MGAGGRCCPRRSSLAAAALPLRGRRTNVAAAGGGEGWRQKVAGRHCQAPPPLPCHAGKRGSRRRSAVAVDLREEGRLLVEGEGRREGEAKERWEGRRVVVAASG